jgi:hypothetical protein
MVFVNKRALLAMNFAEFFKRASVVAIIRKGITVIIAMRAMSFTNGLSAFQASNVFVVIE